MRHETCAPVKCNVYKFANIHPQLCVYVCVRAVCALVCASVEEKQRKANITKRVHLQTPQVVRERETERARTKANAKKKVKLLALSPARSLIESLHSHSPSAGAKGQKLQSSTCRQTFDFDLCV